MDRQSLGRGWALHRRGGASERGLFPFPPTGLVLVAGGGGVLVLRDVTQRSWGQGTLVLMLVAAAVSYRLATPQLALASAAAFLISETIDWGVYSLTQRPFADRVLLSVAFSAPVDTALFLLLANIWSWQLFGLGLGAKLVAGLILSQLFRSKMP